MDEDLFGENIEPDKFCIFHDESECAVSKFLYHGFLFVKHEHGAEIVSELERMRDEVFGERYRGNKEIHFVELNRKRGEIAKKWISQTKIWLYEGKLKFHFFGVDKEKLDPSFWEGSHHDKIYLRFFEIGIKGGHAWFERCPILSNQLEVTHSFFDKGKLDQDRTQIIHALDLGMAVPLDDEIRKSGDQKSLLIQLTDVLNGVCRLSFEANSNQHQMDCAKEFQEIVERFNDEDRAYNTNSRYYKRFSLSFFPRNGGLDKDDFLEKNLNYHLSQKDAFYCDRKTHWQKLGETQQRSLF